MKEIRSLSRYQTQPVSCGSGERVRHSAAGDCVKLPDMTASPNAFEFHTGKPGKFERINSRWTSYIAWPCSTHRSWFNLISSAKLLVCCGGTADKDYGCGPVTRHHINAGSVYRQIDVPFYLSLSDILAQQRYCAMQSESCTLGITRDKNHHKLSRLKYSSGA